MTITAQPLADQDDIHQLKDRIKILEHQLDWFRKQFFGQKSEKRLPDLSPDQIGIESLLCDAPAEQAPPTETVTYIRKKPKVRADNCVTDDGLRFDDSVPVETHEIVPDELKGPDAEQYTIIDYKETHRLAQRPASYVVLKYRHPVIKRKTDQKIISYSAPDAVFEKSLADVSFLAGMLTDKFLYHLPLYRQHQRLTNSGITLSRTTLINLTKRSIALLKPIYDAQLANILKSRVLAMDETPIKAGRSSPGKMKQAWFWPLYGESDEMAFTFSTTRAATHLVPLLEGFEGVLLTDGYAAYDAYCR
ncbi:transposase, partial [Parendozoicomonas sp. Alg238-R29]|uniref:IS66 family transposase n=1 Tax=Parendozoicomonas sp. Alg238-R29 TaxID=2993446 RepID=UPI00248EA8F6